MMTMRMLSVSLLLCAGMALTAAAPAAVAKGCAKCPDGWNELLGNCYKYEEAKTAWGDAEKKCLSQGGNLASMHSKTEQYFLLDLILTKTGARTITWVGGNDAAQEGVWLWSDGSPMIFTDWHKGQPNNWNKNQHCMVVGNKGNPWEDIICSEKYPSICKKPSEAQ